jgi:hypothetical protein
MCERLLERFALVLHPSVTPVTGDEFPGLREPLLVADVRENRECRIRVAGRLLESSTTPEEQVAAFDQSVSV